MTDQPGTTDERSDEVEHLRARLNIQQQLAAAAAAGHGEQGIADALYELTGLTAGVEDRFGYLRAWAGPERPAPNPRPEAHRDEFLHTLSSRSGATRVKDRIAMPVRSRGEILGVLSLVDQRGEATDDDLFALEYGSVILGLELFHQRNLAEMETSIRRELLDDLLAGTESSAAYARAAAVGHDLRTPHYVVAIRHPRARGGALSAAACRAAAAQHLNYVHGHHADMVILLVDGRPDPSALHTSISDRLGDSASTIGIGPVCPTPAEIPESFRKACRALNIRSHSASPQGASAYDELGFYRLIDAAHSVGGVEEYLDEWLGVLREYDENKNSGLVQTLSEYLECGGNYDETAAALHIARSTLRYRLRRIRGLTGYDLRDVDTRFNLHAATRAWRFLNPAVLPGS
ncbi:PucR family transcriptional regulator [Mycobacterium hubeiense]|uniref:PucR family transcriptional regulator n=1 Tax=Mycobacterium hubeiense TaxID=1867256 RepID=UPI001E5DB704|nr:helix-turn-helix domain-containing protein [Mycobacterium sp. QGD 101]